MIKNARAVIGDNHPPLSALELHEAGAAELLELVNGASAATNEEQEATLAEMLENVRDAKKAAADSCETDYRPHKAAGDKVKSDYKPVQAKLDIAASAIIAFLTPYRTEKRRIADMAAQKARDDAAKAQAEALAAIKGDGLEAKFDAEIKLEQAVKLIATANKIDKAATGLRTAWDAIIIDRRAALNYYIKEQPEAFQSFIQDLADKDARNPSKRVDNAGVKFVSRSVAR